MCDIINCCDCIDGMKEIPDSSIDCIVTSPPYDGIRDYHGFTLDLHAVGEQCFRILKDGGVVVMVIQDSTKDGAKTLTTCRTILDWCDNCGFRLFEQCIYHKHGAPGCWWNKRFRVDHEYIPIFLKGHRPAYFNKEPLMVAAKWAGHIIKGLANRKTNGETMQSRAVLTAEKKCRGTIWDYLGCGDKNKIKRRHPATFPDKLAEDAIACFCPESGIVLDPFMGSGTTAVGAIRLNRHYIGFDCSQEYCDIANERIAIVRHRIAEMKSKTIQEELNL